MLAKAWHAQIPDLLCLRWLHLLATAYKFLPAWATRRAAGRWRPNWTKTICKSFGAIAASVETASAWISCCQDSVQIKEVGRQKWEWQSTKCPSKPMEHGTKPLSQASPAGTLRKDSLGCRLQLSASHMHQDLPTPGTASAAKKETNHNVVKTYNLLVWAGFMSRQHSLVQT